MSPAAGACLAALALVSASAFMSAAAGARPGSLVRSSVDGLSFRHPAAWRVQRFRDVSLMTPGGTWVIAYISPLALRDPCHRNAYGGSCTFPIATLPPGGVLVEWSAYAGGRPFFGLGSLHGGASVSIGGHPARVMVSRPGLCRVIGGEQTIHALITASTSSNSGYYEFTACLRGPGLARAAARAQAILASTEILPQSGP